VPAAAGKHDEELDRVSLAPRFAGSGGGAARARGRRSSCFAAYVNPAASHADSHGGADDFGLAARARSSYGATDPGKASKEDDVFEEMKRLKQERENLESIASTDDGAVGQVKRTASAGQQRARRSSMCSSLDFVGQDSLEAAKKRMTEMHAIKQRMAAEAAPLEPVKQTNFSQGLLTVSAPSNQGARRRHSVYEKPAVAARPTHPQPRRASVTYVQPPRVHVVKKAEPAAPKPAPARAPAPQPAAPPPPEPEKDPEPEPEIVPAAEPEKEVRGGHLIACLDGTYAGVTVVVCDGRR